MKLIERIMDNWVNYCYRYCFFCVFLKKKGLSAIIQIMKRKKTIITWVITALFLLVTGWYGVLLLWGLRQDHEIPGFLRWGLLGIVVLILIPVMAMMVVTALRRRKEIEEGEEDDLGEY